MRTRVLVVVALALLAVGCRGRGPSPNIEGSAREILVVALAGDAISLDPAVAYEFTSTNLVMNVYETLIRYENSDYTRPLPGLAERWTISPDGLLYTFYLRPGMRFASGAPLDAAAVKYSLERTLAINMAPAELLSENLKAERVRVTGPLTVEMRLEKPSSYFLSTLFNPAAAVVDETVVSKHEVDGDRGSGWLRDHSAGSGPFILTSWERDIAIILERNENYWGPRPFLRRVICKDVKDSAMQAMMLERGDVDFAWDVTPLQVEELTARSKRVRALQVPFLRVFYVGMNVTRGPLADVRVRQAIRLALDYEGYLKYLARGHAIKLEGPIIQGLLGYAPSLGVQVHDAARARVLLAEAGYADGFDVVLSSSNSSTGFGPTRDEICAKIQSDLAAVGIRVKIQMLATTAYLDVYRGKKTELNMGDWGADYPDPHNFAHPFGHSAGALSKRVQYANPSLDPLIDEAGHEVVAARRVVLYRKIQEILMREGPWAVLLQPLRVLPLRSEVQGYRYDALNPMFFAPVSKQ